MNKPEQRKTQAELTGIAARKIAELITNTPVEERQTLYRLVAIQLVQRSQNYQADLFRRIAEVA